MNQGLKDSLSTVSRSMRWSNRVSHQLHK